MRRHAVTEGTRDEILVELEESKADRGEPHPKPERAAEFERAIAAVKAGALEVRVKHTVYRIVGEYRPQQHLTTEASRDRILEALRSHDFKVDYVRTEFDNAIAAVELGALAVFAFGDMYRVMED
jgi:hypothetical protein